MKWSELDAHSDPGFVRLGVLGDPIVHSLSPRMQQVALDEVGIKGEYLSIEVPGSSLEQAIEHLGSIGFLGLNVTIPHKQNGYLLNHGDSIVTIIGAVNTISFKAGELKCINTDAQGFFTPIRFYPKGKALVLGAGGAAAAVAFALHKYGWDFCIWNRSSERAKQLAKIYGGEVREDPSPLGCSLVVNATSLGLTQGEEPPLIWQDLAKGSTVYDLVYGKVPTDFLGHALLEGAKIIDGREMLVGQGAISFKWWLDIDPPVEAMREAIGL